MSEALAARDFIVDFLHRELVGPSPLPPNVQPDGEEILRAQDPPRQRYGVGVLFPGRASALSHEHTADDEGPRGDGASPDADGILDQPHEADGSNAGYEDGPDTDQEVTLANEFLPSAMGLSALVAVPDRLSVRVSAGLYTQQDYRWMSHDGSEAPTRGRRAWFRRPVDERLDLTAEDLLGKGAISFERPVFETDGGPALALHVLSRPHGKSAANGGIRLVTFTLINRRQSDTQAPANQDCFFQCGFHVGEPNGPVCFLGYPERPHDPTDQEELSLRLLHRHRPTFAIGHGCAADWTEPTGGRTAQVRTETLPGFEVKPVLPAEIGGLELRMMDLASADPGSAAALCRGLSDEYERWIVDRERETDGRRDLPPELRDTAERHMDNCRECLRRMRDGAELIERDPLVALAFRLMNEAMLMQQVHYRISSEESRTWSTRTSLERPYERPSYGDPERRWRPFQLAFILMNLRAIAEPKSLERDIVDVIWFPTGGGKTEAYLGLSAFSLFLRRLRDPANAGTTILMRYTLRLLTTQQFQRAASLICACELIRRREAGRLGTEPFSIGLWVGAEVTPNTEDGAVTALRKLQTDRGVNRFVILSCPWCGAAMGPQQIGRVTYCMGYRKLAHPSRVRYICGDPDCEFSSDEGLPLAVIDEHIYNSPPTLLIGTVDKFAMLAFRPEARKLFGIDTPNAPPELIIQDELHLVSGSLGSMVGHYETVIDALCTNDSEETETRPKIIGSTATIARAESQVKGLYGRESFLFPPQALKAGDSFFAEERQDEVGRLYVGVFATGFSSHVTSQVRTIGALLQAPKLSGADRANAIDPYWTLMGYFNSLRELGHAATLIRADIREFLNAMWDRLGLRLAVTRGASVDPRRFINREVELTSRVPSSQIPAHLKQLFTPYDGSKRSDAIDVCFATNMIQVGLDVPRLSLMTIVGQPKTTSEYIQASSRIGRDIDRPGLVVTNYNPFKSRDRSHYEHFRSYHENIYRHVEPTSVTPFALPVRERALHALIVILSRFWGDSQLSQRPYYPPDGELVLRIKQAIRSRVMSVDPSEWPSTEALIDEIIRKWSISRPPRYGGFGPIIEEIPLMHPAGSQRHPQWLDWSYATPSSMRNVDAECAARPLLGGYGETALL